MSLDARRLLADLFNEDRKAAHQARLVLGGLGPDDEIDVGVLVNALAIDGRDDLVFWASIALGRLGPKASAACTRLATLARSHSAFGLRQAAIQSLVKIAPGDPLTKGAVFDALGDPDASVRREALQSVIAVPGLGALDLDRIASMQFDPDVDVRRWVEIATRNITLRRRVDA